jgi:hypothetical protein
MTRRGLSAPVETLHIRTRAFILGLQLSNMHDQVIVFVF